MPVAYGNLLLKFRAHRVIVASGIVEQPLVFPGNDLVGVMLPDAVRRLVNGFSIKPGERAVVLTVDDRGLAAAADLEAAGVEIARVVDFREAGSPAIEAQGKGGKVAQVSIDGYHVKADLVVMSGSPQPNYKLLAQAGARVEYDEGRGVFVPTDLPDHVEAVGAVTGDVGEPAVPSPILDHRGDKCFVCFCEDQTTKDLKYAIAEGFDSIELSKRYTTVTMGPCQGRLCHTNSIRVYAKTTGIDENTIGTTTARPPYTPISMGLLAGPPQEPRKRTSLHHRHKDMGGTMMWTGAWRRPHSYGPDAGAEAQHVHRALGLIDVSTLGKILVTGPDAGAFLDRVYPNRFSDLKVGRTRYGVLTGDAGRIMDDGVVARDRRRHVLRLRHLDRRGRRLPVVHLVERGLVHGRPVRQPDGRARGDQRRRAERARGDAARLRRRLLGRRVRVPRRQAGHRRRRADARAPDRLRRRARLRAPLPEPARRARLGHDLRRRPPTSTRSRSASSRSGSSGSRRAT